MIKKLGIANSVKKPKKQGKAKKNTPDKVVKNTLNSIKTIVVSELEDSVPFLGTLTSEVSDIISEGVGKLNSAGGASSSSKKLHGNITKAISSSLKDIQKNLLHDIKTGEWIREEEDDELFDLGFSDMKTYSESGEEGTYSSDSISDSDTFVAEANARAISKSTSALSKSISSSTLAQIEANKNISSNATKITVSALSSGFNVIDSRLSNILDFTTNSVKEYFDNTANYQRSSLETMSSILDVLNEMKEATTSFTKDKEDDDYNKSLFRRLFGSTGNSFDVREFTKVFVKSIGKDITDFTEPFMEAMQDNIKSPMKALFSGIFNKYTKRTREKLTEFDSNINDLVVNAVNKLFSNSTVSSIARDTFRAKRKVESDDYFKGDLRWNGYAQKSLLDVIPGYLARIESWLTKSPELKFDYERGKWITVGKIKKELDSKYASSGQSAASELVEHIYSIVDMNTFTTKEREKFNKARDEFFLKVMKATSEGRDIWKMISQPTKDKNLLTNSDIFNAALTASLKYKNKYFSLDPKLKNKISASLLRERENLSEYFQEEGKKVSSIHHHDSMTEEIKDLLQLRNIEAMSDIGNNGIGGSGKSSNKSKRNNQNFSSRAIKDIYDREKEYRKNEKMLQLQRFNEYQNQRVSSHNRHNVNKYKEILDIESFLLENRNKMIYKNLVRKYSKENWRRLYKEYRNDKISNSEFDIIWSNKNSIISFALDMLMRFSGGKVLPKYRKGRRKITVNDATNILNELIDEFNKQFEYITRDSDSLNDSIHVTDKDSSLYGMTASDFINSKFKSRKRYEKIKREDMEDHIKDAEVINPIHMTEEGSVRVLKSIDSLLSIPDKLIYGVFNKVDTYLFNSLFDNGKFFGDSSYKGIVPTIKETALVEFKQFGQELKEEIIDPLASSVADPEKAGVYKRIANMLGITGKMEDVKYQLSRYFNGERDEDGNLIHVGLKHEIVDELKNESKSLFGLGAETLRDIVGLGRKFDGPYAEGGLIGSGLNKKPSYFDNSNKAYDVEKEALNEFVASKIWDNIQSFAEGGKVNDNSSDDTSVENNTETSKKATNVRVVSGKNGGVVITAQSGESVLTREQTESLIKRIKIHIKNGTASPEDIELAKKLGITYKISKAKNYLFDFIKKEDGDEESSFKRELLSDISTTFSSTLRSTVDSLFNTGQKEAQEKIAKSKSFAKVFGKEASKNIASLISGGIIGGASSLLITGLNPFLGISMGAALALAGKSEKVKSALFGTEEDPESGLVSKNVGNIIREKLPKTAMGGILGSVGSTLLFGNPMLGLFLGSALGYASQTDDFKRKMFGTLDPEKILKNKEKMKKILPASIIGAGIGAFTGPFGLIGNVLLGGAIGSATGLLNMNGKLEKAIFGEKAEDGKYYGGLLPSFREIVLEPIGDKFKKLMYDTKNWFKDAIYSNIKKAVNPLSKGIKSIFRNIGNGVKSAGKKVGKLAGNTKIGRGVRRGSRKLVKLGLDTLSLPLYAIGGIGKAIGGATGLLGGGLDRLLYGTGMGAGEYTLEERLERSKKYDKSLFKTKDGLDMYTQLLSNAGTLDNKLALRDALRFINTSTDEYENQLAKKSVIKDVSKRYNDLAIEISKNGGWKKERQFVKFLKQGKLQDAVDLLENDTQLDENMRSTLLKKSREALTKYNEIPDNLKSYEEVYEDLKSRGFDDDLISRFIKRNRDGTASVNKKSKLHLGLQYVDHDISKGHNIGKSVYNSTRRERERMETENRFSSVDKLIGELSSQNRFSDLENLQSALMNMHLSGSEISQLKEEGLDESSIKGYNSYKYLKSLGIDDELINTFSEKDKIALNKSIKAELNLMDKGKDVGLTDGFKFEAVTEANKAEKEKMNKTITSISEDVSKYLPIIAASTGLIEPDKQMEKRTGINNKVIQVKNEMLTQEVEKFEEASKNRRVEYTETGKKKIINKDGSFKFDKSDKQTREILQKEEEFARKFSLSSPSSVINNITNQNSDENDKKDKSGLLSSLFGGGKFGTKSLFKLGSLLLLPSILNNAMGGEGGMISSLFKSIGSGLLTTIKSALGLDTSNQDGSTNSDEEDVIAREERTTLQNFVNDTYGSFTGRTGYMGETDTFKDTFSELGNGIGRKMAYKTEKGARKISNTLFNSEIGKKFINKNTVSENTKNAFKSLGTTADTQSVSKFTSMIEKLYSSLKSIPNFGEIFSNSKFINTLSSFCSDKSILQKIDFKKLAQSCGNMVNKLGTISYQAIDKIVKGGGESISKFVARAGKKWLTSDAKMIPFIGIAFSVADVVSGMLNYKDLLGISSVQNLSLMQQVIYRILAGILNLILNLPGIWVFSLLASEETLIDTVLEIADTIVPGSSKLTDLRNSSKAEISRVNEILRSEGKDEISTVKQLNEYYKRNNIDSRDDLENVSNINSDIKRSAFSLLNNYTNNKSTSTRTNPFAIYNNNNNSSGQQVFGPQLPSGVGGGTVSPNNVDFVGKYVKRFESGDAGSSTISSGKGDYGGVSYGSFQFASFSQKGGSIGGSAKTFWENNYAAKHKDVKLVNNDKFKQAWLSEVNEDPNDFFRREHDHVMNGYYKKVIQQYPDIVNYIKSRAMQESIMSTAVQYGVGGAAKIYKNVLSKYDPATVDQNTLINAIQQYKSDHVSEHFSSSSKSIQNSLKKNRIPQERELLSTLTSLPVSDTSRITGDIRNYNSNSSGEYLDPNSINGESSNEKPTKGYLGMLSSISDALNGILSPSKTDTTTGDTTTDNSNFNSGSIVNGLTSADDFFGYRVTSKFAEDRGGQAHSGIDYGFPEGTPVKTPVSGKVEINKYNPGGYGNYIGIRDENKMLHIFGHLKNRNQVKKGATVSAGDTIGISGNTGASTGPHLHYEVTNTLGSGRKAQDPNMYLSRYSETANKASQQQSTSLLDNFVMPEKQSEGTGGQSVSIDKISGSSPTIVKLLENILKAIINNGVNTKTLLEAAVKAIYGINNGDLSANTEKGKEIEKSLKSSINSIKQSGSMNADDIMNTLISYATV